MKLNWRHVKGTQEQRPAAIDTTSSKDTVYLRKNIAEVNETQADGETIKMWAYDEASVTAEEYGAFSAILEAIQIAQSESVAGDENQVAIMAAQAELYEQNLIMQENQAAIMAAVAELYEGSLTA